VKPVFSRPFGNVNLNLKKGCTMAAPADQGMQIKALRGGKGSKCFELSAPTNEHICVQMTCVGGSLWALRRR
jgi:hypothetical protein